MFLYKIFSNFKKIVIYILDKFFKFIFFLIGEINNNIIGFFANKENISDKNSSFFYSIYSNKTNSDSFKFDNKTRIFEIYYQDNYKILYEILEKISLFFNDKSKYLNQESLKHLFYDMAFYLEEFFEKNNFVVILRKDSDLYNLIILELMTYINIVIFFILDFINENFLINLMNNEELISKNIEIDSNLIIEDAIFICIFNENIINRELILAEIV